MNETRRPPYALDLYEFLLDAIDRHRRASGRGLAPKHFIFHPALRCALVFHRYAPSWMRDDCHFAGIPIVWDEKALEPKMVSAAGTIESL